MSQLDKLWEYQAYDLELINFEMELKNSPSRKKLYKIRNFLVDGQNTIKNFEAELQKDQARIKEMEDSFEALLPGIKTYLDNSESIDGKELQEVQGIRKTGEEVQQSMINIRRELSAVINSIAEDEKKIKKLRMDMSKAKKEFDELKEKHEGELSNASAKHEELKSKVAKKSAELEGSLLERYKSIRKNRVPVIALVEHDQCTGCNMSLPSLVIRNIKDGGKIIECENCGRILYLPAK